MQDNVRETLDVDSPPQKKSPFTCFVQVLAAFGCLALLTALLLPNVRSSREAAHRTHCRNNLKQIALALHNYHDVYDAFPPAYTVDSNGKPLHSWRTLILPYHDAALSDKQLYEKIDLSKPWDDPANAEAYETDPRVYRCPSASPNVSRNHTTYLAVVTPNSCLQPTQSRPLSEVTDAHSETLLLIEVPEDHAVHWMAPQDANEQIIYGLGPESRYTHTDGSFAAFVDGSVQWIKGDSPTAERRAMISATGQD